MNAIDKLMAEVASATSRNNGEIVAKACALVGVSCTKCNYPTNVRLFELLLQEYALMRIDVHRYNKRLKHWMLNEMQTNIDFYTKVHESTLLFADLRVKLQSIWPCEDCTKLFNPTARLKLGPKKYPHKQGVLDYV